MKPKPFVALNHFTVPMPSVITSCFDAPSMLLFRSKYILHHAFEKSIYAVVSIDAQYVKFKILRFVHGKKGRVVGRLCSDFDKAHPPAAFFCAFDNHFLK